jgi:hypothetical protein
MKLMS